MDDGLMELRGHLITYQAPVSDKERELLSVLSRLTIELINVKSRLLKVELRLNESANQPLYEQNND